MNKMVYNHIMSLTPRVSPGCVTYAADNGNMGANANISYYFSGDDVMATGFLSVFTGEGDSLSAEVNGENVRLHVIACAGYRQAFNLILDSEMYAQYKTRMPQEGRLDSHIESFLTAMCELPVRDLL